MTSTSATSGRYSALVLRNSVLRTGKRNWALVRLNIAIPFGWDFGVEMAERQFGTILIDTSRVAPLGRSYL
jgi:hypothetical protein